MKRLRDVTKKTSFFVYIWDVLKTTQKKTYFLRCIWKVLKRSQKRRVYWDVTEKSLRCLSQRGSVWDISKTSHVSWDIWIDKSLSVGGKSFLLVALNYRSFAPTLRYQAPARNACRSYWLDVTWTSKEGSTPNPTYRQYGGGCTTGMVIWDCWKFGTLHEFVCHLWAGAMLIFSVLFQFQYMCRQNRQNHTTLYMDR